MAAGYCCLILHAHLPFVRHPEYDDCLEERWLYEAVLESYLPLLDVLDGWRRDGVRVRLALSLSPTLAAMLDDPLLRERCARYLATRLELARREVERTRWDAARHAAARFYEARFAAALEAYETRWRRDLAGTLVAFAREGWLEMLACSATHAFLPLLRAQPAAVKAQLRVAAQDFAARMGAAAAGLWTGECGCFEELDAAARAERFRYTIVETHALAHAQPPPVYGVYAPAYGPGGLAYFARDPAASRAVWSADEGYPGHPLYREFYRDAGFDLEWEYVRPFIHESGQRVATGVKYHRVTGRHVPLHEKALYDPDAARAQAWRDAERFVAERVDQVRALAGVMDRPPLIVAPFDAELFGHWWYEGPIFLDAVGRRLAARDAVELLTPSDYLARHGTLQILRPQYSSWGEGGYAARWLAPACDWMYPLLDEATRTMSRLARREARAARGLRRRTLNQMARELLLAQSSDWAFHLVAGVWAPYAERRIRGHLEAFDRLAGMIEAGRIDETAVAACEARTPLFPNLQFEVFA